MSIVGIQISLRNLKIIVSRTKTMKTSIFKTFFLSLCIIANTHFAYGQTASILPPAKTTFVDQNGKPLTSGTVDFYIPSSTTRKTTWQDAAETVPNTNPVVLDAAGRALILGSGSYRQIVKDRYGNIIWDQVTSSTGSGSSGPTATGDGDLVGTIKPWAGMTAPNQYAFTYGQEVSRVTYTALFTAITSTQAVFCNSGSPIINGLSDTTNFWIGMTVELPCVAATFSTIVSKTSTTVTLAANANVTTNATAVFFPWGRGNGTTTFNLPDLRGFAIAGNNNMGGTAASQLTTTYFGATNPNSIGAAGGNQNYTIVRSDLPNVSASVAITDPGHTHQESANTMINAGTLNGAAGSSFNTQPNSIVGPINTLLATTGITASLNLNGGVTQSLVRTIQPTKTANYIIKITPDTNSATASGVTSLGGMTGDIACGAGLLCTGNNISNSGPSLTGNNIWTNINTFNAGIKTTNVIIPNEGIGGYIAGTQVDGITQKLIMTVHNNSLLANSTDLISAGGGLSLERSDRSLFGLYREIPGIGASQSEFFTPNSVYFNIPGGTTPTLMSLYDGSNANPVTSIRPSISISRNEATTADTEGGQNAALLINLTSNNVSAVGEVAQGNALTVYTTQNGSGENVAGFFAGTNNSSTGARFWSSYGIFALAVATGSKSSATGINGVIANNTGVDCPYASISPGGATCSEIGVFQQSIGANLHSAGMLLYSNSGQFDVGYATWVGSIKTAAFEDDSSAVTSLKIKGSHTNGIDLTGGTYSGSQINATGFVVGTAGDVSSKNITITSASAQILWSPSASNVGINFGIGGIQRRASDGHIQYNSQNGNHEFLNSTAASAASISVGQSGGGAGSIILYGATSGAATLAPQAVEGTTTLTLPNTSGTLADGASAPLVLNTTTGNLTCPTCFITTGGTITGSVNHNVTSTIASATSALLDDLQLQAATTTITGTTAITTGQGFNKFSIYQPTYTDSSSVTITNSSTLYIGGPPLASGSATLTNAYTIAMSGQVAETIGMWRQTTAATSGNSLTISSGGAASGGSNLSAGAINLTVAASTGNSNSSTLSNANSIIMNLPQINSGSSSTDNTPSNMVQFYNVSGFGTICLGGSGCSSSGYHFQGNNTNAIFNVPTSGNMNFRIAGTTEMTLNASGAFWIGTSNVDKGANNLGVQGLIYTTSHVSIGTVPVGNTGSCTASSFVGGATAGKFSAAVCTAGTFILSSLPAAPNGYTCNAQDQTTPADTLKQTANTTTSVTFTATTVAADVVAYSCMAW